MVQIIVNQRKELPNQASGDKHESNRHSSIWTRGKINSFSNN